MPGERDPRFCQVWETSFSFAPVLPRNGAQWLIGDPPPALERRALQLNEAAPLVVVQSLTCRECGAAISDATGAALSTFPYLAASRCTGASFCVRWVRAVGAGLWE